MKSVTTKVTAIIALMFIIVSEFKEGIQLKKSEMLTQVWFLRSNIFIRYISNPIWLQIWYIFHSWKFESSSSNQSRVIALYVSRNDTM